MLTRGRVKLARMALSFRFNQIAKSPSSEADDCTTENCLATDGKGRTNSCCPGSLHVVGGKRPSYPARAQTGPRGHSYGIGNSDAFRLRFELAQLNRQDANLMGEESGRRGSRWWGMLLRFVADRGLSRRLGDSRPCLVVFPDEGVNYGGFQGCHSHCPGPYHPFLSCFGYATEMPRICTAWSPPPDGSTS